MTKPNLGFLVFFYCLKTLGWVATTVGVFVAFRYLHAWLHSAWKKELQRSFQSDNRANEEDEYAQEDSISNERLDTSATGATTSSASTKNDL